eukprot:scaffold19951_cov22-Tisochrysis_lutea.AAC.2
MVAVVKPADLKYYTKVQDYTDIHVTGAGWRLTPACPPSLLSVTALLLAAGGRVAYPTHAAVPSASTTTAKDSIPALLGSAPPAANQAIMGSSNTAAYGAGGPRSGDDRPACTRAICEQAVVTVRFMGYYRVWQVGDRGMLLPRGGTGGPRNGGDRPACKRKPLCAS